MPQIAPQDINVRVIRKEDFEALVDIDAQVFGSRRPEYYERKIHAALNKTGRVVTSLVAEVGGKIVGFIMGEVFLGEFGIPESTATIDTLGVHPEFQRRGIADKLMQEFLSNLKAADVKTVQTRINWNDWGLLRFFEKMGFSPAKVINLELKLG
jgi:ribosomal protein S18 acetylase RimI-like enzyme